ncbi:50S ribosomal protein L11 methyltransferase [Legionella sp. W05-934-2]|jgi:ribosomal protein L11 methyltransferase|uniref:50S ribosomal protein L11 methyltransferase n=1 Tax=Legionella sp. W05-934-2 TaxID=1198649 RepID=UPI00346371DF
MSYYELTITDIDTEQVDALSEQLESLGALSITCTDQGDNPIFEPKPGTTPLWPESVVTALFSTQNEAELAREILQQNLSYGDMAIVNVADQAWERVCMDDFHPMQFGKKLWICPSWTTPPDENAINIQLDPGLAFGTGTHSTTALCLTWLDSHPPAGKIVLDFGCGSGILAIAALKLGAEKVFAVDIDPQAHEATENNAMQNDCDHPNQLIIGEQTIIQEPVDVVLANVLLDPLLKYRDQFMAWSKPKATLVLSGLLENQCDTIIKHYQSDCRVVYQNTDNEWGLVVLEKLS